MMTGHELFTVNFEKRVQSPYSVGAFIDLPEVIGLARCGDSENSVCPLSGPGHGCFHLQEENAIESCHRTTAVASA